MAIAATTTWELRASATAANVNGGGFNRGNANFLTNYAATVATGNSPVLTSASYTFVAGDVGAWVYVSAGTNWTPGFYQIASVAGGAATLSAAVGAAVQFSAGYWQASTVAGCATVASPTGGTCGIDYSQADAAIISDTDLACTDGDAAAPVVSSALKPFGVNHAGNIIKVTAGTGYTVGWYEIVSVSGVNATLDRAVGTDGAKTGGTFYVGGALSLGNANDDSVFETTEAGNIIFIKNGTYTMGATVSIAKVGTAALPIKIIGYGALRGDKPRGDTRPLLNYGASTTMLITTYWHMENVRLEGTNGATLLTAISTGNVIRNSKFTNKTTTANWIALYCSGATVIDCEASCYRGYAFYFSGASLYGCYAHDSKGGFVQTSTVPFDIINCIAVGCVTAAIDVQGNVAGRSTMIGNTIVGYPSLVGVGINVVAGAGSGDRALIMNNIITGFVTGIAFGTAMESCVISQNDFYNNTTDVTNVTKGANNVATNPSFASYSEVTGATATTSGSVLTQAGGDFSSITAGRDFCYLVSGTGITAGIYGISSKTTNTLTLDIAPGTDATADKVFKVVTGRDFNPGTNMQNLGFPGAFPGGYTTGYVDLGAVSDTSVQAGGGGFPTYHL